MALGKHMEPEEAQAIMILSSKPEWALFKKYLSRLTVLTYKELGITKDDHRYYQGMIEKLELLGKIETKAKNLLEGV